MGLNPRKLSTPFLTAKSCLDSTSRESVELAVKVFVPPDTGSLAVPTVEVVAQFEHQAEDSSGRDRVLTTRKAGRCAGRGVTHQMRLPR